MNGFAASRWPYRFSNSRFRFYCFAASSLNSADYQFVEFHNWIPSPPIHYHLGVDGISLFLVLLTTFLTPVAILASWKSIEQRVRGFFISLLVLETGVIGVFVSLDLFLFFLFWEAMLIPMYFLIGIWGHERRIYAAIKFILYTMFGSILMLVAMIWLYELSGSFDLPQIQTMLVSGQVTLSLRTELLLFAAFFLAFAIKVPLFPLHTWLPDAHTEAPTAGSVMLAGVLLKMGTYGMLRFCLPLFPEAAHRFAPYVAVLAIIGIIYGALVAMVQTDLKRLVAYSSVSHLGFVVLGLFAFDPTAVQGALLPNAEPRRFHRRALRARRNALRPPAHAPDSRIRRPGHSPAGDRGFLSVCVAVLGGASHAQWIRRRVPDFGGHVCAPRELGVFRGHRHHSFRRLPAVGLPARFLRRGNAG